jgi:hypothetical protein
MRRELQWRSYMALLRHPASQWINVQLNGDIVRSFHATCYLNFAMEKFQRDKCRSEV